MKFNYMKIIRSRFKFLYIIFFISLLLGIIIYLNCDTSIKNNIDLKLANIISNLNNIHQNQIIIHLFFISLIIILSCYIVGFIPLVIYYIYEATSIGFLLSSLLHYYKLKGLYYFIIIFIVNKFIYIILLSYIFYLTYKYIRIYIKNNYKITSLNNYLLRSSITMLLIMINDIILYFYGNKLIDIFI